MSAERLDAGDAGTGRTPHGIGQVGFEPDGVTFARHSLPLDYLSVFNGRHGAGELQHGCAVGGVGSSDLFFPGEQAVVVGIIEDGTVVERQVMCFEIVGANA